MYRPERRTELAHVMTNATSTVIILNPVSGNSQHSEAIRNRATLRGYSVKETEKAGDAVALARQAAHDGASNVIAAGGDGTLNEVIRGVDQADAFDSVTIGVIPAGTGNNFAHNIGVPTIEKAFDVLENGDRRRVDLGRADGHVFINSCVGGLTATASDETPDDLKTRIGVLAYVITTLRTVSTFEGIHVSVRVDEDGHQTTEWSGTAVCVLIGNGRRFSPTGRGQANMEDGLFEVTIVEDMPTIELVGETVVEQLFGGETNHITSLKASALEITTDDPDPITFSLDGEMVRSRSLSLNVEPNALHIFVGEEYNPSPTR